MLTRLPEDAIVHILGYFKPYELVGCSCVNRMVQAQLDARPVWRNQLTCAIKLVASRSPIDESQLLTMCNEIAGSTRSPKYYFFVQIMRLPTLVASCASCPRRQHDDADGGGERLSTWSDEGGGVRRCVLSLDRRAYDVTPYLEEHPGGRENMTSYSGRDATKVFDLYGHSEHAHALMRARFLVFDAPVIHPAAVFFAHLRPVLTRALGRPLSGASASPSSRRPIGAAPIHPSH